jgi:ribosomal protein S18 acetylase RimI-like enzyme
MVEIRPLRAKEDLHDLILLSREFFSEYEAHYEAFFKIDQLRDSDIIDHFTRFIDDEDSETYIAVVDGRTVGYINIRVRAQAPFWQVKKLGAISGLMVNKAYRRRGIAGQLLDRAKAFFKEKRVRYFTLYTAVGNRGAIEFYGASGLAPLYTTMMGEVD